MKISQKIKERIDADGGRAWANDNISEYMEEGEKAQLIEEAMPLLKMYYKVQNAYKNRSNSMDTASAWQRCITQIEIMSGRYDPCPIPSAFPTTLKVVMKACWL